MSCGHFVKHYAEAKQIRTRVKLFTAHLLWRHVCQGSKSRTGQSQQSLSCQGCILKRVRLHMFGQAKVQYFGLASLGDKDVGRLDVAMDDTGCVRCLECVGDLDGQIEEQP